MDVSGLLQRGIAAISLIAFVSAWNQFPALLGERGLLPVRDYLKRVTFRQRPSLFHWRYSDRLARGAALAGIVLSALVVLGLPQRGPLLLPVVTGLVTWFLYLSFVNVGQDFYGFGWESMLLEAGFLAAFLGATPATSSFLPVLWLRWMLFRTELGAGLIKLRHDSCWRDLTCLDYHHETQPLPNRLSRVLHRLPKPALRAGVVMSHVVQIVVPFGLLAPQPVASIAGALIIGHQLLLIVGGNYSWLNWLAVVLGLSAFGPMTPLLPAGPLWWSVVLVVMTAVVALLSIQPIANLFRRDQLMNFSYNSIHLVNTYGAFGQVTRARNEVVIEGTRDDVVRSDTPWREYGFKAKPGDVLRAPRQVAPYHLRLDWMMWFLPFTIAMTPRGPHVLRHEAWFIAFLMKLLDGDRATLALLAKDGNPFPDEPPRFVRASYWRYRFATPEETRETGAWWVREKLGEVIPPIGRSPRFAMPRPSTRTSQ